MAREVELQFHEIRENYNPGFDRLGELGFGKIIVRSFLNNGISGGLLFKSRYFRTVYPGFDDILKQNKNRKFQFWGWLIARNYDWLASSEKYDTGFRNGKRVMVRKLDIFDPRIREMVVAVFKEMAGLGVDGILIQDDLSIKSDEGFTENGMRAFTGASGVPAKEKLMMESGSPYNLKWIEIKKKVIRGLLDNIISGCRSVNPDIRIGINVFYESLILAKQSREWHSQDIESIAGSDVDLIYLMMYHRQMKNELKLGKSRIRELFRQGIERAYRVGGDRIVVKMETFDWSRGEIIPLEEMREFIRLIPGQIKHICFTPVKGAEESYLKGLLTAARN